jgi:hypothetical protein
MRSTAAIAALCLLGTLGCGSSNGDPYDIDRDDPGAVAQGYVDAVADGDAEVVCELVDPEIAGDDCADTVGKELAAGEDLDDFDEVTDVETTGDAAQANFEEGFLRLSRIDGAWYVDLTN